MHVIADSDLAIDTGFSGPGDEGRLVAAGMFAEVIRALGRHPRPIRGPQLSN